MALNEHLLSTLSRGSVKLFLLLDVTERRLGNNGGGGVISV